MALLNANAEFYRAFRSGDIAAMTSLWADREDIVCIHPGHASLRGREQVLGSWFDILSAPPPVTMQDADGIISGDIGIVTCVEIIEDAYLTATNLFAWTDGDWTMVHHHASQIFESLGDADDQDQESLPTTLH